MLKIGKVESLNNEAIIESVVKKFPSPTCKSRYVDFKIYPNTQDKSELQILREIHVSRKKLPERLDADP